jgi:hypothetical protein
MKDCLEEPGTYIFAREDKAFRFLPGVVKDILSDLFESSSKKSWRASSMTPALCSSLQNCSGNSDIIRSDFPALSEIILLGHLLSFFRQLRNDNGLQWEKG